MKFVTTMKKDATVEEVMNQVNDYLLYGKEFVEEEVDGAFCQYANKLEEVISLQEIQVKRPFMTVGLFRKIKVIIKKTLRKALAWWLEDIMSQQSQFNTKVAETLLENKEVIHDLMCENKELKRELERKNGKTQCDFKDEWYLKFEDTFRGSKEEIRERYKKYMPYFEGKNKVVDFGCGRGELLELLQENGIPAMGVDINHAMIMETRKKGFQVEEKDCIEYLLSLEEGKVDGMFAGQLVEHLSVEQRNAFVNIAYQKLKENGVLIIETVNPLTLGVFCYGFYIDPTHSIPVHPAGLRFMLEQVGFEVEPVQFDEEFPDEYKFEITEDMSPGVRKGFDKLNQQIFGAQDYYLVCRKR
ncbi:MAG: methyltransferase domain-containing protein [Lachnospiraceae bacterium]|nr:methyltransferase domain-containing protein [Lachnospiraceae bacterium]